MDAQPATIQKLATAVPQALALLAAMELGVFTPLRDAPLTTEQLASALGVRAEKLRPLLAVLVSAELLRAENGLFANTPESSHFLVGWRPSYMGSVWLLWSDMWSAELKTARSIRTGVPQAKHDFAQMSERELSNFLAGSDSGARSAARALMNVRDLSRCQTLLDVGGGLGGFAVTVCEAFSNLHATVIELPEVARIAQNDFLGGQEMDVDVYFRVQVVPADITRELIAGKFDVAVCNRFLQVLAPSDAARAVANIARVLKPNGWVHIIGHILDDSGLSPTAAVNYGLLALNLYEGGQAFSEQLHREWLCDAGFGDITREILPNGYSLMSARKSR